MFRLDNLLVRRSRRLFMDHASSTRARILFVFQLFHAVERSESDRRILCLLNKYTYRMYKGPVRFTNHIDAERSDWISTQAMSDRVTEPNWRDSDMTVRVVWSMRKILIKHEWELNTHCVSQLDYGLARRYITGARMAHFHLAQTTRLVAKFPWFCVSIPRICLRSLLQI